jgi:transcriptional regulator with XRE-family HTH domain
MNNDQPLRNQPMPFSMEGAERSQALGPSRFARALKQARFARGWTQAELAQKLSLPKRALVSWETAERVPSIGMVLVLLDALRPEDEMPLQHELVTAYIADDLNHLQSRNDQKAKPEASFAQRLSHILESVLHSTTPNGEYPASQERDMPLAPLIDQQDMPKTTPQGSEQQTLEPLLALMAQFQQHPELIIVVSEFMQEIIPVSSPADPKGPLQR